MFISIILFTLFAVGCMANVLPEDKETKLALATNSLAFDLLNTTRTEKNVFISPFSISAALAMLYLGADGTTAQAMRRVLKYDQYGLSNQDVQDAYNTILDRLTQNTNDYHFTPYNSVLIQDGFQVLETYKQSLREYYSAQIESVDFANHGEEVQTRINAEIENTTRGKIKDFLAEPPSEHTVLFLLNVVYFLGSWKDPFNIDETREATFYNNGVEETRVQMMFRDGDYRYSQENDLRAHVVVLPYRGDSASMIIVLPDERAGIAEIHRNINREALGRVLDNTQFGRVLFYVPKFSLAYPSELSNKLSDLGLQELFSDSADLSGIVGDDVRLKVSKVQHKAVVDVDEKGTEAAGVTGIEVHLVSAAPVIYVNHPFLFFIRDEQTGVILFAGRVDEL